MTSIREATQADVDVLFELIGLLAEHHGQQDYVKTETQEMIRVGFNKNPKFGALIAEHDGKVAGYLSYTWNYSIWAGEDYMNIDDVFVLAAFRQKDIGKKLMMAARALCSKKGVNEIKWEVETDNHRAIVFYERIGAKLRAKGKFSWVTD